MRIWIVSFIIIQLVFACSQSKTQNTPSTNSDSTKKELINGKFQLPLSIFVENSGSIIGNTRLMKKGEVSNIALFRNGYFSVPKESKLIFKFSKNDFKIKKNQSFRWTITTDKKTTPLTVAGRKQNSKGFKSRHTIKTTKPFTISANLVENRDGTTIPIKSISINFKVSQVTGIRIIQPAHDIIKQFGEKIKFVVNATENSESFPTIVWLATHNNIKRVLGIGYEISTSLLDIGNNTISAYAIDTDGNSTHSNKINVMIPYQAIKTKIIKPANQSIFEWDQPIYFFARGNELEYALDNQPFQPGSGFLKKNIASGEHLIKFRGKFGTAEHKFLIKEKLASVAKFSRVEGYVMMSGKKGQWTKVKPGDNLSAGHIVRAVGNGLAELHLANGLVYILNLGKSIRITTNGSIIKNINREELALYALVDPESINEIQKNLRPMVSQLDQLLSNYEISELDAENNEDIIHLLDLIFKGQLKIDEIIVE